jgi:hypothetical protein
MVADGRTRSNARSTRSDAVIATPMLDFVPNHSLPMPLDFSTVAIVLDADFGAQLHALASRMPVWIVDAPGNRASIESEWTRRRRDGAERELSVFRMIEGLSPSEHIAALLRTIDAHHGESAAEGPFVALLVFGAGVADAPLAALRTFGGGEPVATSDGFRVAFAR